jgi:hypothetical protein
MLATSRALIRAIGWLPLSPPSPAAVAARQPGESSSDYQARLDKARPEINKRLITLIHACFQVWPCLLLAA